MSMWLYQLNQKNHPPSAFRYDIWENQRWHWDYGMKRGAKQIEAGDTVVFFYSVSAGDDPGIYAWAVIERCSPNDNTIYFIPTAPSNHLKMDPWWDDEAEQLVNKIRGKVKQGTLFPVAEDIIPRIRRGITKWLCPKQ